MTARRRSIPSVLHNVLDTLQSRYSDHGGYWIYGFLVGELAEAAAIDLLGSDEWGSDAWRAFVFLARARFVDQIAMNGVARFVRRAELTVEPGAALTLTLEVESDQGRSYRQSTSVNALPHDPTRETRSRRRGVIPGEGRQARVPRAARWAQ